MVIMRICPASPTILSYPLISSHVFSYPLILSSSHLYLMRDVKGTGITFTDDFRNGYINFD